MNFNNFFLTARALEIDIIVSVTRVIYNSAIFLTLLLPALDPFSTLFVRRPCSQSAPESPIYKSRRADAAGSLDTYTASCSFVNPLNRVAEHFV